MGLWRHEASPRKHPPDRGHRRHLLMSQREVIVDRLRPGIQTEVRELLAQPDDLILELHRRAMWDLLGRSRSRLGGLVASLAEPAHDLADPTLGDPVSSSHVPVAPPLQHHRIDHVSSKIHRRPPS